MIWEILGAIGSIIVVTALILLEKQFGLFQQRFRKVDRESSKHGGMLVAEVLKAHGVKHIFTLCGGHISPILVSLEKLGVRVIDVRHEATAVFAADATARMSGSVGVAIVTAGPGLTNTITAVKNAQLAESPVVIIGGAAASILKNRGALQDIDQMSLFKPLCKFCGTVRSVREIVPTVKRAICVAQSGTPGPVFLEFPIDTLFPYAAVLSEIGMKTDSKSFTQKIVSMYLQNYVDNIFDNAWSNVDYNPLPVTVPLPNDTQVQACAELIQESKRPVILLGSQVTLPPVSVEELSKTLKDLGIPCYLGGMARGLLGRNCPIQMRQKRREALREADLVVLAGSVCDFRLSYGRILSKKSKIIAINRNKDQLYKNSDLFWKPTLAIQSDSASFILAISKLLTEYSCSISWIQTLRTREQNTELENSKLAGEETENHLNPLKILSKLEENLDDNAILIADGGDFVATAAYTLRPRGPLLWLDPGAFGTLGVGAGFALGAKLCRPESEVWIIYGDGSCGYGIIEYDTFNRHKTPILSLVGNDGAWMQIARDQLPRFESTIACMLKQSDYHKIVEVFGAKGYILRREDDDRIDEIIQDAKMEYRKGHSVMINALIGNTRFRDGSISNSSITWKPTVAAISDVASFIIQVADKLHGYSCNNKWIETLQQREIETEKENKIKGEKVPEKHLNSVKILQNLEDVLDENTILVADGGDFVGTAAYVLRPRSPLSWLDPGAFGTLGVGGGFALGAKLCRPDSDVVIIYGDGSCGYSIIEYDTYIRHKIPVMALIGNDAAWMQMARDQVPRFGTAVACLLQHSEYQKIAEALGSKGFILRREDNDNIKEILLKAKEELHNGHSVIVNALIGKTDFREGSISV